MTEVRDWNKDMELCERMQRNEGWSVRDQIAEQPQMSIYWLQQYAAEKERADKATDTAAEWICKYNGEEARFQRQNRELAETKERVDRLHSMIEDMIEDIEAWKEEAAIQAQLYLETEAREKKLREAIEKAISQSWSGDMSALLDIKNELKASLYPKEEEAK
ncbi:hypothetical protein D3C76_191040 [compost metagenome]